MPNTDERVARLGELRAGYRGGTRTHRRAAWRPPLRARRPRSRSVWQWAISALVGPFLSGPGCLEHARECVEPRLGEERRAATSRRSRPHRYPRGGRGWSRAASDGVVQVQRSEPVQPDDRRRSRSSTWVTARRSLRMSYPDGEQVARIQADPNRLIRSARTASMQRSPSSSNERPRRARRYRRCSPGAARTTLGLRSSAEAISFAGPGDRLADIALLGRTRSAGRHRWRGSRSPDASTTGRARRGTSPGYLASSLAQLIR